MDLNLVIYHVTLPPEAFATLKGFLAVTGDLMKSINRKYIIDSTL